MSNIKEIIEASLLEIKDKFKDIDLEIGLQIELIIKLRKKLEKDGYKIIPEKNLTEKDIKKEIDIVIENEKTKEKYAIELKMPPNKAMPKRMSQAIVDIKFLEKLVKAHGFNGGFFIMLTNNHCFWEGNETDGIYHRTGRSVLPHPDPPRRDHHLLYLPSHLHLRSSGRGGHGGAVPAGTGKSAPHCRAHVPVHL